MRQVTIFIFAIALAFSMTTFPNAHADEASKVSYSKKKQGGVPFVTKEDKIDESVADIEPAAGAELDTETASDNDKASVADDIKLPRK